jgi:hypothetical protein
MSTYKCVTPYSLQTQKKGPPPHESNKKTGQKRASKEYTHHGESVPGRLESAVRHATRVRFSAVVLGAALFFLLFLFFSRGSALLNHHHHHFHHLQKRSRERKIREKIRFSLLLL